MENKEKIVRKLANRVSNEYKLYPPVDFKKVLLQKGIKYREEKLVTNGDGYSDLRDSGLEIVVNSDMDYLPRKRFTIAHELGHIFIGWHDDVTLCRTDDEYAAHNMLDIQEKEANIFASELLMPTEWVKEQLERYADYGLDYVIRKLCDDAETSLMACFYALENAMQSGNVLLVFIPSIDFEKSFVANNTEICYFRNMDFAGRCEALCTEKWEYTIGTYRIRHYQLLPCPSKSVIKDAYRNYRSIIAVLKSLSNENYIFKSLHNLGYIINSLTDKYAVWVFQEHELLLFSKNSSLQMQISRDDSPRDIISLCDHYKYDYENGTEEGITIIAVKEPVYEDVKAWEKESTESKYLCNKILDELYTGKEQDSKRRVISGIIGNANNVCNNFSVEALYNLIQKKMRRPELDDFVFHPEFNRFVSLKSFELVRRKKDYYTEDT